MQLLDRVEFWHNRASDTKFVWFPFHSLKPEPAVKISMIVMLKMVLLFGIYYGVFAAIRAWIFGDSKFYALLLNDVGLSILFFCFWFNIVTLPLWNRRARRLAITNNVFGEEQRERET